MSNKYICCADGRCGHGNGLDCYATAYCPCICDMGYEGTYCSSGMYLLLKKHYVISMFTISFDIDYNLLLQKLIKSTVPRTDNKTP